MTGYADPDRPTRLEADRDAAEDERDELAAVIREMLPRFAPREVDIEAAAEAVLQAGWHR